MSFCPTPTRRAWGKKLVKEKLSVLQSCKTKYSHARVPDKFFLLILVIKDCETQRRNNYEAVKKRRFASVRTRVLHHHGADRKGCRDYHDNRVLSLPGRMAQGIVFLLIEQVFGTLLKPFWHFCPPRTLPRPAAFGPIMGAC